jgi:hypothetical protein
LLSEAIPESSGARQRRGVVAAFPMANLAAKRAIDV